MQRGLTGRYEVTNTGDETVNAFLPDPLPPKPPLAWDGKLLRALEKANIAVGRLDGIKSLLPNRAYFLYSYIRKEAVLSSQIEGTQSSLSDLLRFELDEAPGVPRDDITEVVNYVAAMEHGLRRLQGGFPLSNRLLREIHGILLASGRGSDKRPGEFRRSQNWIGGSRPGNAIFVPPPHTEVQNCMANLEKFFHQQEGDLPTLIRVALSHVQFETIHPFLDGNGRIGRLLVPLLLFHEEVLNEPLLYLSLYLKQQRDEYYNLLQHVRLSGDWEAWILFFLEGVRITAEGAVATVHQLLALFDQDRERIKSMDNRVGSMLRVHEPMKERPILSLKEISLRASIDYSTASRAIEQLTKLGITREITGKRRGRLYAYDRYLAILSEGTEPL